MMCEVLLQNLEIVKSKIVILMYLLNKVCGLSINFSLGHIITNIWIKQIWRLVKKAKI